MSDGMMMWSGRGLMALFVVFMVAASIAPKLLGASVAKDTLSSLGWSETYVLMIGLIELACLLLYLVPQTRLLGAVLMTALLGGAIATHLRVGSPLFSHTLFGVYLGVMMWGSLWLRDAGLRAMFPVRF